MSEENKNNLNEIPENEENAVGSSNDKIDSTEIKNNETEETVPMNKNEPVSQPNESEQKLESTDTTAKEATSKYETGDVYVAASNEDETVAESVTNSQIDSEEPIKETKKKFRFQGFTQGLVGAIVGALLVIVAQPLITGTTTGTNTTSGSSGSSSVVYNAEKQINVSVESQVTEVVSQVEDAVVGVINIQNAQQMFSTNETSEEAGTGSGVIYKKSGNLAYVVTNNHVVDGASSLEVTLSDGTRVEAELVGTDVYTDLAVLTIDGTNIETVATFGSSESVKKGETVIAIGNPLGEDFSGSVTQGIISGKERTVEVDLTDDNVADWEVEVLQTDAAINPGNSGGALVNMGGEVIGINSMKISDSTVEGIGFSIPSDIVQPVLEDLEQYGEVKRPYLGISMQALSEISTYHWQQTLKLPDDVTSGVTIMGVEENSPAAKAGLEELDVVVALDGTEVGDVITFRKVLYDKEIGDSLEVTLYRDGKLKTITVNLTETQL